jgi:hypothetical protein
MLAEEAPRRHARGEAHQPGVGHAHLHGKAHQGQRPPQPASGMMRFMNSSNIGTVKAVSPWAGE